MHIFRALPPALLAHPRLSHTARVLSPPRPASLLRTMANAVVRDTLAQLSAPLLTLALTRTVGYALRMHERIADHLVQTTTRSASKWLHDMDMYL